MTDHTFTLEVQFRVPTIPKFIKIAGSETMVDIAELTPEVLDKVIACWGKALHTEAELRRAERSAAKKA